MSHRAGAFRAALRTGMPAQSWEELAAAQSAALAAAGIEGTDPAALAALLAGRSGRVKLALLDRADLGVGKWRKVLLPARLPATGVPSLVV